MKYKSLLFIIIVNLLLACQQEEKTENVVPETTHARRTIIMYACGDNNLSASLQNDIKEAIKGSADLADDCRLILFADFCKIDTKDNVFSNELPYIAEITDGKKTVVKEYPEDFYSTSADNMTDVLQWIVNQYPANEYALILSGHANGPIVKEDSIPTQYTTRLYAYGGDATDGKNTASDIKWLNIPSLATVLSNLKDTDDTRLHFDYVFFDCCCMQTIEVAYELRNYTDYITAVASETPDEGAPYASIVPILGEETPSVGEMIIDRYIENSDWEGTGGIAISTIKTSELECLMEKTREALHSIHTTDEKLVLDRTHCIYYYRGDESDDCPVLHDMKNVMMLNLPDKTYNEWLKQFDKTIVYKYTPASSIPWLTNPDVNVNFLTFTVTENNYGGVGMIVPNVLYDKIETRPIPHPSINKTMYSFEWANAIGWKDLGW